MLRQAARTVLTVLAALICSASIAGKYPIKIDIVPRGQAKDIYVENQGPAPINVVIDLTKVKNMGFNPVLIGKKFAHLLAPGQRKYISTAVPMLKKEPAEFDYRVIMEFGDSRADPDFDYVYRLPIADNTRAVMQPFSELASGGMVPRTTYAVEFQVPVDTPVVAARDGIVIDFQGGDGEPDATNTSSYGNYISIMHNDGTWAIYGWLKPGTVHVTLGQEIKTGEEIARSWKNPDVVSSYIHFAVLRNNIGIDVQSIGVVFHDAGHKEPINAKFYTGPVSPNLLPRYPEDDKNDTAWVQPDDDSEAKRKRLAQEELEDEFLTPAQRQERHHRRVMDAMAMTDGGAVSSDSMVSVAVVGVGLAVVGLAVAWLSTIRVTSDNSGVSRALNHLGIQGPKIPEGVDGSSERHGGSGIDNLPAQAIRLDDESGKLMTALDAVDRETSTEPATREEQVVPRLKRLDSDGWQALQRGLQSVVNGTYTIASNVPLHLLIPDQGDSAEDQDHGPARFVLFDRTSKRAKIVIEDKRTESAWSDEVRMSLETSGIRIIPVETKEDVDRLFERLKEQDKEA